MHLVTNISDVHCLINDVKSKSKTYLTNLYTEVSKIERWISDKILFFEVTHDGVLFFRADQDFYHVYYCVNNVADIEQLLRSNRSAERFVSDIIGRVSDIDPIAAAFYSCGFRFHTKLYRFIRINGKDSNFYQSSDTVVSATADMAPEILNMLHAQFDKYSEQLATMVELEELIKEGKVLVINEGSQVKGFLVRSSTANNTILNNFMVDNRYRGEKIGSKLLKHYIHESKEIKRMVLWVLWDNEATISIYKHHEYKQDTLCDFVLIR